MKTLRKILFCLPVCLILLMTSTSQAYAHRHCYWHHGQKFCYWVNDYPRPCKVWVSGYYDMYGYWIPGHWRYVRCDW